MGFDYRDNFLFIYTRITRSYRKYIDKAFKDYDLTPAEIDVLAFLINNEPKFNKASDISYYRGVSKGLVSRSVKALEKKGLVNSKTDLRDKRSYILTLTDKARPIAEEISISNKEFKEILLKDISKEDLDIFHKVNVKMMENIKDFND